jgi:Mlc titration factor MtfA (ptsG expression regulator)
MLLLGVLRVLALTGFVSLVFAGLLRLDRLVEPLGRLLARLPLRARVRLPTDPIPDWWDAHLARHVPLVSRLAPERRGRLQRIMQRFLEDIAFEGCAGFEVTDPVRVTIAAQACLLLLEMPFPRYPRVRRVLVYPSTFVPRRIDPEQSLTLPQRARPAAGEAGHSGVVVLSWTGVEHGTRTASDGYNVVVHEFAHMLDGEDGVFDGTPVLDSRSAYRAWARTFADRFARHARRTSRGKRSPVDAYGAENRAEFFATAVEAFFERPQQLRAEEPDVYAQLVSFFRQDPAGLPVDAAS